MDKTKLIEIAYKATANSIPGRSNFKVGAVLVSSEGKIFTGCNIESSTSLGICAERVALLKALSEGERVFSELVICTENGQFCSPCGSCRQMLLEYAPNLIIIMANRSGDVIKKSIGELLPMAFDKNNLDNHVVDL